MPEVDFAEVRGQEAAKRALLIALAGNHSIALIGPRHQGKSMLLERALKIAPGLRWAEVSTSSDTPTVPNPHYDHAAACEVHCEVPPVPFRELTGKQAGTSTADFKRQLAAAKHHADLFLSAGCLQLAKQAYDELGLTPYSFGVITRVARTIANLDGSEKIGEHHLAEAIQYRLLDRKY